MYDRDSHRHADMRNMVFYCDNLLVKDHVRDVTVNKIGLKREGGAVVRIKSAVDCVQ
jgi:hypothetical protein